jgi:hypothetical protein
MPVSPRHTSKLLVDEPPLIVLPSLAVAIGLPEAILLQQIHYWLRQGGHVRDGRRWIYNSYPQWAAQLPFWKEGTVRGVVDRLRARGLLLTGNYNASPADRTTWYTIDYDALEAVVAAPPATGTPSAGSAASSARFGTCSVESGTPCAGPGTPSAGIGTPSVRISAPIPETTTETTSEITPEREGVPPPPAFESFTVQPEHTAWWDAVLQGAALPPRAVDVPEETAAWRDAIRAGRRPAPTDPAADWRQWMRRAVRYAQTHPSPQGGPHGTAQYSTRRTAADDAAADAAATQQLIAALDALAGPGRLPGDHPGPDPLP